jgi:ABC-2 type transport system ATP-binding protein
MIVAVEDLVFDYPLKRALHAVSIEIEAGGVTAVVGPNGAGKTTLLRCIAGLDRPSSGAIHVDGVDVLAEPRTAHRRVGFLQDFFGLYDSLSVARCLDYTARARAVPAAEREARIGWAAELLGLSDRMGDRASTLSRGLRQRLAIAQTIIHRPPVLLLDEPAAGLDPEARDGLAALFRTLRDGGCTLLVSSHILAELEDYSTDMVIVEGGRIISHAKLNATAGQPGRQEIEIRFSRPVEQTALKIAWPDIAQPDSQTALAGIADSDAARSALLRAMLDAGLPVLSFGPRQMDLSRFYLDRVAADRKARAPGVAA